MLGQPADSILVYYPKYYHLTVQKIRKYNFVQIFNSKFRYESILIQNVLLPIIPLNIEKLYHSSNIWTKWDNWAVCYFYIFRDLWLDQWLERIRHSMKLVKHLNKQSINLLDKITRCAVVSGYWILSGLIQLEFTMQVFSFWMKLESFLLYN